MGLNFNNDTPIFLQIIDYIKMQILSKNYLPNQKLLSVREMSLEFGVNPNTIQKALKELEEMGLIYTESTNGKFVTNNEDIINSVRNQTTKKIIDDFFNSMQKIGLSKSQTIEILNKENL